MTRKYKRTAAGTGRAWAAFFSVPLIHALYRQYLVSTEVEASAMRADSRGGRVRWRRCSGSCRFAAAISTPDSFAGTFSLRRTHEAQIIPSMGKIASSLVFLQTLPPWGGFTHLL